MNIWLTQHLQAIRLVLSRLKKHPVSTLFIGLAIAVSLALPIILYLLITSVSSLAGNVTNETQVTVFLKKDADATNRDSIHNILASHDDVKNFKFVSKDDALNALTENSQHQDILAGLNANPLPDAFFVTPNSLDSAMVDRLLNTLRKLDGVKEVYIDNAWLNRLNYLLNLGQKAMLVLSILLGFAVFAVIGNTIRMQILTQQDEIALSQLIGATKSFIRRPFLYAGIAYSLLGALMALLISSGVIILFNQSITKLAAEYQTQFSLLMPTLDVWLTTLIVAITIGLISSYLAVSQSLQSQSR